MALNTWNRLGRASFGGAGVASRWTAAPLWAQAEKATARATSLPAHRRRRAFTILRSFGEALYHVQHNVGSESFFRRAVPAP